uniref:BAR domain-containing protein n=1 Tax=Pavo cristatus TaxID=9049 RepID=A0A8C9FIC4_PAVCR
DSVLGLYMIIIIGVAFLLSEKVGGAEGTKLDDDFKEMERKVDVTSRAVMEIMAKTIEYLQPNPVSAG